MTFKLSHVPAGTALTVYPGSIFPAYGSVPLSNITASITINPSTLTVSLGQTAKVVATFHPPTGLDKAQYPVFSILIQLSSPDETYHISYLGLAASLKEKQVLDNTEEFFGILLPAILQSGSMTQVKPRNYTFVGTDTPKLLFRLAFGTAILRVDFVDPNIDFVPTIPLPSSAPNFDWNYLRNYQAHHPPSSRNTFLQVKMIGLWDQFNYVPRNDDDPSRGGSGSTSIYLTTKFANGTTLENGDYRVLVCALKVTGDPQKEEDYESWLSRIIGVRVPVASG